MLTKFINLIFSPQGTFPSCGMFTAPHIIATSLCLLVFLFFFLIFKRKIKNVNTIAFFRIFAIIISICESIKITHSFINGYIYLDAWVPISYCSLFIYSLWLAGFTKGFFKSAGEAFITYGCPIAGLAFLIFPTTSLMNYPIWHFLSIYSMLFHTLMLFLGAISLYKEIKLTKSTYFSYVSLLLFFAFPAIILNITKGSNLMNLREPYNIPIDFLQNVYQSSGIAYTILVLSAYLLIPFLVAFLFKKVKFTSKMNRL